MGILSDPEYSSVKWVRVLKKINGPLCHLCYLSGLIWFMLLAKREFNNETYFSENALLPGLVTNEFNGELNAKQYYNELLTELNDKYEDTDIIPVPWLVGKMSQLHLEVYTHNFTLDYPFGQGQMYIGTNVYGILRAPRTSNLEALVVSAPFRPLSSHQKSTAAGIALMLAFAQFARPQKYWAKDIIFLITEHEQLGMQAWLEAYHGINSDSETFYKTLGSFWKPGTFNLDLGTILSGGKNQKWLNPGKLKGRSGSIQAAINLEIHDPKIRYVEVKVEGLNGQLPNLDLVNLVHKLCIKSSIHHSYKNSYSWMRARNAMVDWYNSISTMLGMVTAQIAGVPNGNHGLFHRFGIEAVTLEGRDEKDAAGMPPRVKALSRANFHRLGVALESILRSLNNLLERFHQSFFFYLLADTNRFISIGQYMPSLCLLCLAMLLKALSLWVSLQKNSEEETDKKTDKQRKTESEVLGDQNTEEVVTSTETTVRKRVVPKSEKVPGENETEELEKEKDRKTNKREESSMSIANIGVNYFLVHCLGYVVMNSPAFLSYIGATYFDLPSEMSVYYGLIIISILLTKITPLLPWLLCRGTITHEELSLVNILLLIELVTVCLCVGIHNFPLGLSLAVVYTPLALVAGVVTKGKRRIAVILKRAFCLLLHPLMVLTLGMITYSSFIFLEEPFVEMVGRGRDAAMQAIMFSVVDSLIYGNWLFNVATMFILPIWIIFWQILCYEVDLTT